MAAVTAAISITAHAQFTNLGAERGSLKWNYITSPDYKVIYPVGMDSLAFRYGALLQTYRYDVGRSAGYLPNQYWRSPMPVVLHPFAGISNGAVVQLPHRMELYTMPDAYGSIAPLPWERVLAIHENRHVAQMQFAKDGFWGWWYIPFGEFPAAIAQGLYANPALLEGDAVVTETALTNSGRGRTADFLAYYRMAWDNGDIRNWYKWRYGSLNHYTPDHYALGYVTVAGTRTRYDAPMFMAEYLNRITEPWAINALHTTVKRHSGKKFNLSWLEIAKSFNDEWRQDDSLRGPFQSLNVLTPHKRGYTSYRGAVAVSNNHRILAIRAGLDTDPQLVEISSHGIKALRPFESESRLTYSHHTNSIYWTVAVQNLRWEQEQDSRIQVMDLRSQRVKNFTKKGRYVNPSVSPDGRKLVAVEYPIEGGSRVVLFDIDTKEKLKEIDAPAGVQFTEPAFWGDDVVLAAIQDGGSALYLTDFTTVSSIIGPYPYKIRNLCSRPEGIYLSSDRNGTNEIYLLDPGRGTITQKTNTKYGATEPFFLGEEMYFTALQPAGKLLVKADDGYSAAVDPADIHTYAIADELSLQEDTLRAIVPLVGENPVEVSEPMKYGRLKNLFHIHSWIPLYTDTELFSATYSSYFFERMSLGATAFFQNLTGTASGSLGVSVHPDPSRDDNAMTGGFHARMQYSGLYPVFDMALDVGDRPSAMLQHFYDVDKDSLFLNVDYGKNPKIKRLPFYIGGKLKVSVPMNFSRGGWTTMLRPYASLSSSSDLLLFPIRRVRENTQEGTYEYAGSESGFGVASSLVTEVGLNFVRQTSVMPSQIMPRLGFGVDLSGTATLMDQTLYGMVYAYTPGFFPKHGVKYALQAQFGYMDATTANTYWPNGARDLSPRGLTESGVGQIMNHLCPEQEKLSLDYAIQAFAIDTNISQYVYLRNMEFVPFADVTRMRFLRSGNLPTDKPLLYSVGMDATVRFERLLFFSSTIRLGVRFAYNGGDAFDWFKNTLKIEKPYYIGFITHLDL